MKKQIALVLSILFALTVFSGCEKALQTSSSGVDPSEPDSIGWTPENDDNYEQFNLNGATDPLKATVYLPKGSAVGSQSTSGFNNILISDSTEHLQNGMVQFQILTGPEDPDLLNTTVESYKAKYSYAYSSLEVKSVDKIKSSGVDAIAVIFTANGGLENKQYIVNHNGLKYVFVGQGLYGDKYETEDKIVACFKFTD